MKLSQHSVDIAVYLQEYPAEPYQSVGARFGVSRQRVHQIAKVIGVSGRPMGHPMPSLYPLIACSGGCGAQRRVRGLVSYRCRPCGRKATLDLVCGRCGGQFSIPAGRFKDRWIANHRRAPHLKSQCPECWKRWHGGRLKTKVEVQV